MPSTTFPSAIRRRDDAAGRSPAPLSALLPPGAGEPLLTVGQKIALLKMRRSDWAKAILAKLTEIASSAVTGDDFRSLVPLNLAIAKGSLHVLTSSGRWRADQVALQIARSLDFHVITYDWTGPGRACFVRCTCGFNVHRQQRHKHLLGRSGANHLAFVASQHAAKAPAEEIEDDQEFAGNEFDDMGEHDCIHDMLIRLPHTNAETY
jgi:hypothetical protein